MTKFLIPTLILMVVLIILPLFGNIRWLSIVSIIKNLTFGNALVMVIKPLNAASKSLPRTFLNFSIPEITIT